MQLGKIYLRMFKNAKICVPTLHQSTARICTYHVPDVKPLKPNPQDMLQFSCQKDELNFFKDGAAVSTYCCAFELCRADGQHEAYLPEFKVSVTLTNHSYMESGCEFFGWSTYPAWCTFLRRWRSPPFSATASITTPRTQMNILKQLCSSSTLRSLVQFQPYRYAGLDEF